MNSIIKIFLTLLIFWVKPASSFSQNLQDRSIHASPSDSLLGEFRNSVYYTFYNPKYMTVTTPTFTMLKVDIDKQGKVTDIRFSDSADSTFVKAWVNRSRLANDKETLTKYAKLKGYKNLSLLIPVSYQPNYPYQKRVFTYDELDGLMQFNKQSFSGQSILLDPIKITVLPTGNM